MDSKDLLKNISAAFVNQTAYRFDKYVPEFMTDENKFFADCYNNIIVEPKGEKPPRFYHTFSPFDVISNKAPDRALVFENGEQLLNIDFAPYIALRTGAMDALLLEKLGVKTLKGKKILYIGAGKVAQASLKILKECFTDLETVFCKSNSGNIEKMQKIADVSAVSEIAVADYDYIFCHTNAKEPVLTSDMLESVKAGAVITTFISSTEHGEVADEYYSDQANLICDWEKTLTDAKDLGRAVEAGSADKQDVVFLKDLISGSKSIDSEKRYTIYRSTGTPIQNLAVLQILTATKAA